MTSVKVFISSLFLCCMFAGVAADIGIITSQELKALLDNPDASKRPIVLDTRGGYKDYFRGHIPGAHHINFDTLRGTDKGVPVQYLPVDLTKALLGRAGIDKDRLHVIYAYGETLPNDEILSASMVQFVLEKYGVKKIKILDGGVSEWAKSFPTTQEYGGTETPKGNLPAEMDNSIYTDVEGVLKDKGKPGVVLVDARPKNEYLGDDKVWLRKGHIPGAISFHWARAMTTDNTHKFKPADEVKKELEAQGITPDKDVLVYCGTSREGSLLRFYLRHVLNYPKVRLYEGSWKEYASLKQYPAEK